VRTQRRKELNQEFPNSLVVVGRNRLALKNKLLKESSNPRLHRLVVGGVLDAGVLWRLVPGAKDVLAQVLIGDLLDVAIPVHLSQQFGWVRSY